VHHFTSRFRGNAQALPGGGGRRGRKDADRRARTRPPQVIQDSSTAVWAGRRVLLSRSFRPGRARSVRGCPMSPSRAREMLICFVWFSDQTPPLVRWTICSWKAFSRAEVWSSSWPRRANSPPNSRLGKSGRRSWPMPSARATLSSTRRHECGPGCRAGRRALARRLSRLRPRHHQLETYDVAESSLSIASLRNPSAVCCVTTVSSLSTSTEIVVVPHCASTRNP